MAVTVQMQFESAVTEIEDVSEVLIPVPRSGISPRGRARVARPGRPLGFPGSAPVPFFSFWPHGMRTAVSHTRGGTHATRLEGHLTDQALHRRRLTWGAIV